MKKLIALSLTSLLIAGGMGMAIPASGTVQAEPVQQALTREAEQYSLYLVPGTYMSADGKVENTIADGADKLTEAQCGEIFTENAYICTLSEGDDLPVPASVREDSEGNAFTFNGWWTIVDATVTYFDKVPSLSENTFLYADWRADLSQRMEPVVPDESTAVKPNYYMSVYHADTEETEIITLYVSGTDASSALQFGYGAPVQFYNEWFELLPGDEITVYVTGLGGSETPQVAPLNIDGKCEITFERSSAENNDTADYLERTGDNTFAYTCDYSLHFRIYVKFYDAGATMTIYMQPQE